MADSDKERPNRAGDTARPAGAEGKPFEPPAPDQVPHDFVDAEFEVMGLESAAAEAALHAALSELNGLQSLSIAGGKVAVEYDPLRITKIELEERIRRAGFRIGEVEIGPASPITDALHPEA